MHLVSFKASGKDYQPGAGASAVAGTQVLVPEKGFERKVRIRRTSKPQSHEETDNTRYQMAF